MTKASDYRQRKCHVILTEYSKNIAKGLETTFKRSETLEHHLKLTINNTMDTDFLSNEVLPAIMAVSWSTIQLLACGASRYVIKGL